MEAVMHPAEIDVRLFLPAFVTAMQDRRLRGHAREIYVWLYFALDVEPGEFRPIKSLEIQVALQIGKANVSRSLQKLIALGYIERAVATVSRVSAFRLRRANADADACCRQRGAWVAGLAGPMGPRMEPADQRSA